MPRPLEREKPLQRVNVMMDCDALEKAQRKAAKAGVAPATVGSTSAFIRWLIDNYLEGLPMNFCAYSLIVILRPTRT